MTWVAVRQRGRREHLVRRRPATELAMDLAYCAEQDAKRRRPQDEAAAARRAALIARYGAETVARIEAFYTRSKP